MFILDFNGQFDIFQPEKHSNENKKKAIQWIMDYGKRERSFRFVFCFRMNIWTKTCAYNNNNNNNNGYLLKHLSL